ncbi:MAG: septal ring lytic transglycosylase RlpA family protein [Halieaceae bacterium]|jgi:rare lipoprotein A|nr:septal ring lytic transglycosylase RlpA family protein [Halieaceae bacterium]
MKRFFGGLFGALLTALGGCGVVSDRHVPDTTPPPISAAAVRDAVPAADPILRRGNTSPYTVNGQTYRVMDTAAGYVEEGVASWYGLKFHGRPTATGERFSVYQATAAHRSLPLPTYARVTNLANGRQIVVKVNDRGPFHADRILDLSYGAAIKLGFADQGTARVRVEAIEVAGVDDRRAVAQGRYRQLQLGAFSARSAAQDLAERVRPVVGVPVEVTTVDTAHGQLHRLRAGPFASESALRAAQGALQQAGLPEGQALP